MPNLSPTEFVACGFAHVDNNSFNPEFIRESTAPGISEKAQSIFIAHSDDLPARLPEQFFNEKKLAHVLHQLGRLGTFGLSLVCPDFYANRTRPGSKSIQLHFLIDSWTAIESHDQLFFQRCQNLCFRCAMLGTVTRVLLGSATHDEHDSTRKERLVMSALQYAELGYPVFPCAPGG